MIVQILVDNINSWIIPFAKTLQESVSKAGFTCSLIHNHAEVTKGDVLVMLSCEQKFEHLHLNKHNLVVHESALPQGKGWSPMTWQIIEGKSTIAITLFEANLKIDDGPIYESIDMRFDGTELIEDWRDIQGKSTIQLVMNFLKKYPSVEAVPQKGESSFYKKRKPEDSELDCNKTIAEQFDTFRVVDNERYPAYFNYKGQKYKLKIEKYD